MFRYRYVYQTVSGMRFQDFDAEDDEEAERVFWDGKLRDLNEVVMVSKSALPVEEERRRPADQGDEEGLRGTAGHLEERLDDDVLPGGRAKRTYLGRRADVNAKETALYFLCGMAGALALVVAQRLLG